MIEIILLEAFKEGYFGDVVFPGLALIVVLLLIFNSILNKWGFTLW